MRSTDLLEVYLAIGSTITETHEARAPRTFCPITFSLHSSVRATTFVVGLFSSYANDLRVLHGLLVPVTLPRGTPVVSHGPRHTVQRRIVGAEAEAIVAAYRSGKSVYELAVEHSCHRTTISGILKRSGVAMRRTPPTDGQIRQMVRLYESGLSLIRVGERVGYSGDTVHRYLRERGVRMREGFGGPVRRHKQSSHEEAGRA